MNLSGVKDVDYQILNELLDRDLVRFCRTDKAANKICKDDKFWFSRTVARFPDLDPAIMRQYKGSQTWAQYYVSLRPLLAINSLEASPDMDKIGDTIYKAIVNGRLDILMAAVSLGINLKTFDYNNVVEAAKHGHLEVIKYLKSQGFIVPDGYNEMLEVAASHGYLDVVKYLVELGADVNFPNDKPIRGAVIEGHQDTVEYLVVNGADIDRALMEAVDEGSVEMAKFLLDKGANINYRNGRLLNISIRKHNPEMIKLLIDRGTTLIPGHLIEAAWNGNLELVKYLVEVANIDPQTNNNAPLLLAADKGALEIIKYLVTKGANVNDPNTNNEALVNAIRGNYLETVKYLVEMGAPVTQEIIDEARPYPEIEEFLLSRK